MTFEEMFERIKTDSYSINVAVENIMIHNGDSRLLHLDDPAVIIEKHGDTYIIEHTNGVFH